MDDRKPMSLKQRLIDVNKMFHNGSLRYEGTLDFIEWEALERENMDILKVACMVANRHPFIDGNKRTAIKFMELETGQKVPKFVYKILKNIGGD